MEEHIRRITFRFIGVYQIAGGIWGLYVFSDGFIQAELFVKILSFFFMLPLVAFNFHAGYWLFKEKKAAATLINQVLQIFSIALWGKSFQYLAGANLLIPL